MSIMSSRIKVNKHNGLLFYVECVRCVIHFDQQIVHSSAHWDWFTEFMFSISLFIIFYNSNYYDVESRCFNAFFPKNPSCFMRHITYQLSAIMMNARFSWFRFAMCSHFLFCSMKCMDSDWNVFWWFQCRHLNVESISY